MKMRRHLGTVVKPIVLIGALAIGLGLFWLGMASEDSRPAGSFANFQARNMTIDPSVPMNPLISFEARNESNAEWMLVVNGGFEIGRFDGYQMNLGSFPAFSTNRVEFTPPLDQMQYKFSISILKRASFRERLRRCIKTFRGGGNIAGAMKNLDVRHDQYVTILVTESPTVNVSR